MPIILKDGAILRGTQGLAGSTDCCCCPCTGCASDVFSTPVTVTWSFYGYSATVTLAIIQGLPGRYGSFIYDPLDGTEGYGCDFYLRCSLGRWQFSGGAAVFKSANLKTAPFTARETTLTWGNASNYNAIVVPSITVAGACTPRGQTYVCDGNGTQEPEPRCPGLWLQPAWRNSISGGGGPATAVVS